ncbi:MAG: 4Fe-4S dicluster domain-containing protein [Gemmatimonadetes bacterium]|nr:4Fe-4S dicluster domain-containing protein [Gemmatimonadota bacterium]
MSGDGPRAQHPAINVDHCIGCGACVTACPEGDVLAVIGGKAALVHSGRSVRFTPGTRAWSPLRHLGS